MAHGPSDPAAIVHDHVEADITDLGSYITDVTGSPLDELSDVAAHTPTKGHLLVADGTDWEALSVGNNDQVLTADSAQATGVKWADGGGGGDVIFADTFDDVDINNAGNAQELFSFSETLAVGDIIHFEAFTTWRDDDGPTVFDFKISLDDVSTETVEIDVDDSASGRKTIHWIQETWMIHSTSSWSRMARWMDRGIDIGAWATNNSSETWRWETGTDNLTGSVTITLDIDEAGFSGGAVIKRLQGGIVVRKISST